MSFNIYIKKPNLVDKRLIDFYINKIKEDKLKEEINQENIKQINNNHEIISCSNNIKNEINWYDKYIEYVKMFIKENYGFVIITSLIIILLYVRYIEVKRRKKNKLFKEY
jgi:hypothetical protein